MPVYLFCIRAKKNALRAFIMREHYDDVALPLCNRDVTTSAVHGRRPAPPEMNLIDFEVGRLTS